MTIEEFKSWIKKVEKKPRIKKVEKKPHRVYCIICSKATDITNGGSLILQSHQKGKTHIELVMKRNEDRNGNLFKKRSADSTATTTNKVKVG